MKSKHIAKAIGVLSYFSDEYYDKEANYDGQPSEWRNLRSAIRILTDEIEKVAKIEANHGTT